MTEQADLAPSVSNVSDFGVQLPPNRDGIRGLFATFEENDPYCPQTCEAGLMHVLVQA